MRKDLTGHKLGIIHAALITTRAVQKYIDEIIPEVEVVHWVDDTIQNTNFACPPGIVPPENSKSVNPCRGEISELTSLTRRRTLTPRSGGRSMNIPTTATKALVVAAAAALLAACGGGSDGDNAKTGTLKLSITDSPMDDVQQVWVKFSAVEFKPEGGAPVMNPLTPAQSLNLLELQNGRAAVLVNEWS